MFHIQWGVTNPASRVGHCSFTTAKDVSGDTNRPEEGHLYA